MLVFLLYSFNLRFTVKYLRRKLINLCAVCFELIYSDTGIS